MKVCVIGGLGFCGSHLVDVLKAAGHYVMVIDKECMPKNCADWIVQMDANGLRSLNLQFDYVFHCAGPAGPANIKPEYALRQIMDLTQVGLDFAQRCGARFVKFSSSEVYGRSDVPLIETTPCIITPPYDARSEYQIGFIAAEQLCISHPHPDVQILRLFNVVGPGQRAETGCVLPRFCQQVLKGEPLTIFGSGLQRRAFMYIDDLTAFCLKLMAKWPTTKGVWNVANPRNAITVGDLANKIWMMTGANMNSYLMGGRPCDLLSQHYRDAVEKHDIDITKAQSLDWNPQVGLYTIIEHTLAWYKEQLATTR